MKSSARILIVDDKESVVGLLATILSSYEVSTAGGGVQALERLSKERFDVVVTDIAMPEVNGFQVLEAVKSTSPDTEVVMITAYAAVPDAVAAMKRGAYDYLSKPFDPDDVALVVARALEHRLSAAASAEAGAKPGERGGRDLVEMPFREAVEAARDQVSRQYLAALLRRFEGNVTRAAERAGMERESLHRVLKRYGLHSEDFKTGKQQPGGARGDVPEPG